MWLERNNSSDIVYMKEKSKEVSKQLEKLNKIKRKIKKEKMR